MSIEAFLQDHIPESVVEIHIPVSKATESAACLFRMLTYMLDADGASISFAGVGLRGAR